MVRNKAIKSTISKSFLIQAELLKELKNKARQGCISESNLIRRGINIILEKSVLIRKIKAKYKHSKFKKPMVFKCFLIPIALLKQVEKEAFRRKEAKSAFFRAGVRAIVAKMALEEDRE